MDNKITLKEIILDFIKDNGKITIADFMGVYGERLNVSRSSIYRSLIDLINDGEVKKISTDRENFYIPNEKKEEQKKQNVNQEYIELLSRIYQAEEDVKKLRENLKKNRKQLKKIYIDIISVTAVFVAIISFLIVNVNVISKITEANINHIAFALCIINISVCIGIFFFVLLIRFIIIKPILKND